MLRLEIVLREPLPHLDRRIAHDRVLGCVICGLAAEGCRPDASLFQRVLVAGQRCLDHEPQQRLAPLTVAEMRILQQPGKLRMHGRVVEPRGAVGVPGLGIWGLRHGEWGSTLPRSTVPYRFRRGPRLRPNCSKTTPKLVA